jgi:hypothetical protein
MISDKVRPHHLERKAILYVRQSSAHQVLHNRESSALQTADKTEPGHMPPQPKKKTNFSHSRKKAGSNFNPMNELCRSKPSEVMRGARLRP